MITSGWVFVRESLLREIGGNLGAWGRREGMIKDIGERRCWRLEGGSCVKRGELVVFVFMFQNGYVEGIEL